MLVFLVTTLQATFMFFFRWFTLFGTVYTVPLLIPFRFMVIFGSSDEHPPTWTLKKGVPDGKRCATFFNPFRLQKHHPLLDVRRMFFLTILKPYHFQISIRSARLLFLRPFFSLLGNYGGWPPGRNRGHQVAGMSSLKAFRIVRITRVLKVANSDGFWVVTAEGGGFMGGFSICFFGRINSFQCEFFRFFRNRFCL